jgi:hypothetical protein
VSHCSLHLPNKSNFNHSYPCLGGLIWTLEIGPISIILILALEAWYELWPRLTLNWLSLTLFWCDIGLCLHAKGGIVSWWMPRHCDNHVWLPRRLLKKLGNISWLWIKVGYQITNWLSLVILVLLTNHNVLKKWSIFFVFGYNVQRLITYLNNNLVI